MTLSLPVSSKQQCEICHNTAHVEIIAPPNKCTTLKYTNGSGTEPDFVCCAMSSLKYKPTCLPVYCPSVCSPLCLHLFNDHPTLKCQVTLRAKEEHYTAAPCHAGRHHPHSGFNFSAFYRIFARVHV